MSDIHTPLYQFQNGLFLTLQLVLVCKGIGDPLPNLKVYIILRNSTSYEYIELTETTSLPVDLSIQRLMEANTVELYITITEKAELLKEHFDRYQCELSQKGLARKKEDYVFLELEELTQ